MRIPITLAALGAAGAGSLAAQAPPGTDIHVVSLRRSGAALELGAPRNVTARPGYDNQPQFAPDGRTLYFTSYRAEGEGGQADIYRVDVASLALVRVTHTPESEYSPTPMPGAREIAVIRVEHDSTQRLWAFAASGGAPRLLLERVRPTGYQAWLDPRTVGLYVLGSPATLQVADLPTGDARILLSDIGRSVHVVPGRRVLSVTHRVAEDLWWIVEVDPTTGATTPIVPTLAGSQDYVWLPDGSLLMGQGTALFRHRPGRDSAWVPLADLGGVLPGAITRLAVSPRGDRLALVAGEARP